jgi:hypothetical protein
MRLFQNSGLYPAYLPRLDRLAAQAGATTFAARMRTFLADGFGAAHFLEPVLTGEPTAFLANSDDQVAQRMWALENGLRADAGAQDILLAQIENHRTEVFYNIDPTRYPPDFVKRLPGCVRHKLAWRAAPSPNADLRDYDRVVCNFPSLIEAYRKLGWKADYFFPAHDPAMDAYSAESDRPIDVVFVGGYTRHHRRRAELLVSRSRGWAGCCRWRGIAGRRSSGIGRGLRSLVGRSPPRSPDHASS